ncbi:MAG: hypothetical protein JNN18_19170 [Rubrivivax sp.]|nr:hypothetical protein [Rubrivivax sp.]
MNADTSIARASATRGPALRRIAWRLVAHAGSTRTLLALLALLAAVVFARPAWAPLAAVLGLLGACLAAALGVHPRLRRQPALLVTHLALVALVVLVGLGRLLALDGRFELTQGVAFDGQLLDGERGAWHRERLHALRFRHHGFEVDYAAGRRRGATRNAVEWLDDEGRTHAAVIGDHRPLVIDGHRIYTSPNKGYAPLLRWLPEGGGEPVVGAVHLPSYPAQELRQWRAWTLPGAAEAWVQLDLDGEEPIARDAPAVFRLPQRPRLVVRVAGVRAVLAPGDELAVPGGRLRFEALTTWMGYRISHDPTLPWLLAVALLACAAMAWHWVAACRDTLARPERHDG